jgi:regulator of protease activity HflC (stomatin/prohibitin superfamily)
VPRAARARLAESELERERAKLHSRKLRQRLEEQASGTRDAGFELGLELTALEVQNAKLQAQLKEAQQRAEKAEAVRGGGASMPVPAWASRTPAAPHT